MNALQEFVNGGLVQTVERLGTPVFTFKGVDYDCIPSITLFRRELETGGYSTVRLLNMSVRILDENDSDIFTVLPSPQELITHKEEQYRIISTKLDATGVYMRIMAESTNRGI